MQSFFSSVFVELLFSFNAAKKKKKKEKKVIQTCRLIIIKKQYMKKAIPMGDGERERKKRKVSIR